MRPTIRALSASAVTCLAAPLSAQGSFAHPAPPATAVRVARNVSYTTSDTTYRLEVYQPTRAATARPVVIFSARDRARDQWPTSWVRHAASRGIVSIIPDMPRRTSTGDALDSVVAHLRTNARRYGIDTTRIVLFAGSAGVDGFLPAVEDSARSGIRAVVMFYGTANVTCFRRDLPLLVVRAGLDHPEMNAGIDRMIALAIAQNAPDTVINHHTGRRNFELVDDDIATRQIIYADIRSSLRTTQRQPAAVVVSPSGTASSADESSREQSRRMWLRPSPAGSMVRLLSCRPAAISKPLSDFPIPRATFTSMQRLDESLLLRCSTLHFGVAAADRAPVPVIGHWHPAFDADTHALCGFRGLRRKQAAEKRHCTSPVRCPNGFPTEWRAAGLHHSQGLHPLRLDSINRNKVRIDGEPGTSPAAWLRRLSTV